MSKGDELWSCWNCQRYPCECNFTLSDISLDITPIPITETATATMLPPTAKRPTKRPRRVVSRRRRPSRRPNKVKPSEYAQCYHRLRSYYEDCITRHRQITKEQEEQQNTTTKMPNFTPTDGQILTMFGKDRTKSNHAPAAVNEMDALDPALEESGNYVPSGGPGLGSGCNAGEPCHTFNRQDPIMTGLRLWPEQVLMPMISEMELYLQVWQDPNIKNKSQDQLKKHRQPIGISPIHFRKARPLW